MVRKIAGSMKHERTQTILNWGMGIVSALMISFLIGTIVRAAMFVVPVSDDYWYAGSGVEIHGFLKRIVSAAKFTQDAYRHEQGAYFTSFIGSLFNPVAYGGFSAMRIIMEVNAFLVFGAVIFLTGIIIKKAADVVVIEGMDPEIIERARQSKYADISIEEHMKIYEGEVMDSKTAMKNVAKDRGISKREVYQAILSLKK